MFLSQRYNDFTLALPVSTTLDLLLQITDCKLMAHDQISPTIGTVLRPAQWASYKLLKVYDIYLDSADVLKQPQEQKVLALAMYTHQEVENLLGTVDQKSMYNQKNA